MTIISQLFRNSCILAFLIGITNASVKIPSEISEASVGTDDSKSKQRSWSQKYKQYSLHRHLTSPTESDLKHGVENSRRLAHNYARLGLKREEEQDKHDSNRDLIAAPPKRVGIVKRFDSSQARPSTGPRLRIDSFMDKLPLGDGPGVKATWAPGTRDFWIPSEDANDNDYPVHMWESVACPVADVEKFIEDPLRCAFGDGEARLSETISSLGDLDVEAIMRNTVVPIAKEVVFSFSPFVVLKSIGDFICDIIDSLGFITPIIEGIKLVVDAINTVVDTIENIVTLGFGEDDQIMDFVMAGDPSDINHSADSLSCSGSHLSLCKEDDKTDCKLCLETEPFVDCGGCSYCYRPYDTMVPSMDGICLPSKPMQNYNAAIKSSLDTILLARFINKNEVQENDTIGDIILQTAHAEDEIPVKPDDTGRNLHTQDTKDVVFESKKVKEDVMDHGRKLGISESQVKSVISAFLDYDNEQSKILNEGIKTKMMEDPTYVANLSNIVTEKIEKNPEKYGMQVVSRILGDSIDPITKKLDDGKLKDTLHTFEEKRELGGCSMALEDLTDAFKNVIGDILTTVLTEIGTKVDTFTDIAEYSGMMLLPAGFIDELDPYKSGGIINLAQRALNDVYQGIAGTFMYGDCHFVPTPGTPEPTPECVDRCCTEDEETGAISCELCMLPSEKNQVIQLQEDRSGDIYLAGACDNDFGGELLLYTNIVSILEKLLDAAGDSVLEFVNIPIQVVNYILKVIKFSYDHMNSVCDYLFDWAQDARVDAIYENSRWALRELACRDLSDPFSSPPLLKKGYGCDGLDNTCDDDGSIDECAEDIFPPELDLAYAVDYCQSKSFSSEEEAVNCLLERATAEDDCRPVEITAQVTPETTGTPTPIIVISAVAQGCGNRVPEDTTTASITLGVDGDGPTVTCGFNKQQNLYHVQDPAFIADGTMSAPFASGNMADPLHIVNYEESSNLVDVKLWYQIEESSPSTDVMKVDITVTSNEYENDREISHFAKRMDIGTSLDSVHRAKLYLSPFTCRKASTSSRRSKARSSTTSICETEDYESISARFYDVNISATDANGNVGMTTCHVVVIPDDYYKYEVLKGGGGGGKGKGSITPANDKQFFVSQLNDSKERYLVGRYGIDWDPMLDTKRFVPILPPPVGRSKSVKADYISEGEIVDIEVTSSGSIVTDGN